MPAEAGNLNQPPTQIAQHHASLHNGFYHISTRQGLGHTLNLDYVEGA